MKKLSLLLILTATFVLSGCIVHDRYYDDDYPRHRHHHHHDYDQDRQD